MMAAATQRHEQAPVAPLAPALDDGRQTLVIVGNGMTSWRLCHELVEGGATSELRIVVLGAERYPAYDRVKLTNLLAGARTEDLLLAGEAWYAGAGIELRLGDPVTHIDRDECLVRCASGAEVYYDRLVLATGSTPFVPPMPGVDLPGVFVYRTIDDLQNIRAHVMRAHARARRAVVIGGGLLGLEAARAVHDLGAEVEVIEGAPRLLQRQLDEAGGRRLQAMIEALGVRVRTGARTAGITRQSGGLRVELTGGDGADCDLVILSAGVRPAGGLAGACGLELAPGGGVAVDDQLQSSDERIFAVGECAAHQGTSYGLVSPGYQMVQVLVANLCGGRARFRAQTPPTKLKVLGLSVSSVGATGGDGTVEVATETPEGYRKLVLRRGRLAGALAVGPWAGFDRVAQAVQGQMLLTPWHLRRFRAKGDLWGGTTQTSVIEWSDDAIVCACMGVTRGKIVEACTNGACSLAAVCTATSAGTMCGGCKPLIEQLVQITPTRLHPSAPPRVTAPRPAVPTPIAVLRRPTLPTPTPMPMPTPTGVPRRTSMPPFRAVRVSRPAHRDRGALPLVVAAAVALVATLALAAGPALPAPRTALGDALLAALDDNTVKMITGSIAAGLAALSLLLSLRKRVRALASIGSVTFWRAFHGGAGALAALATLAHTGGRLGANLNLWLSVAWLIALATGGGAGLFRKRKLSRAHVLLLVPLPALLVLHVLTAVFYS